MLQERYRAKLQKQKDSFRKEKEEMVRLVKRECEEIVLETHNLILKQRKVPSDPTHKNRIEPERVENDNNSHISRKSKSKPYSRGSSVPMLITSLTTAGADVVAHLANQHSAIQYNPATVASTNISDDKNEREKPSDKADGNNPQQRIDLNSPKLSDFSPERNFDENNFTTLKNDNRRPTIKSGTNSRNLLGSEDLPGPFPLDESVNSSLSINKGRFDSKRNSNELVRRSAEPVVYPEMISPEETLKLIQNIVHRSLTDQDVQQFFSG